MQIFTPPINFSKVNRKLLSLLTLLILHTGFALAQDAPFITVWQTDNEGISEDNQITIPGTGTDYLIEWEEVGNETNNNGSETGTYTNTVTFPSAGTYRVKISGDFVQIKFQPYTSNDSRKLVNVNQWGNLKWISFEDAFFNCRNLIVDASDNPDLSNVTNMSFMFYDVDSITSGMQNWDISNIKDLSGMFAGVESFNQDIGNWDVSKVTDMNSMFEDAINFNIDLSTWDVSSVKNMEDMFKNATSFNQDISNWQVNNIENMNSIFNNASIFNQNLSSWNISKVKSIYNFIRNTSITDAKYDSMLLSWAELQSIPQNLDLGIVTGVNQNRRTYCTSIDARAKLINENGWRISYDSYCLSSFFVTRWNTEIEGESNNNQLIIPIRGSYLIEWEEIGNLSNSGAESGQDIHLLTLPNPGEYRLKISGELQSIKFANGGDKDKLLSIDNWGKGYQWGNLDSAFYGCSNLEIKGEADYSTSKVTNMRFAFKDTKIKGAMLESMITSSVTDMTEMFSHCKNFNADISGWDVSKVSTFDHMLDSAVNFNQNLGDWDLSSAANLSGMLNHTVFSTSNYDLTLNGWSQNSNTPANLQIGVMGLIYCFQGGRNSLTENKNWNFIGDSNNCSDYFVSKWKTDNGGLGSDTEIYFPGYGTYFVEWEEVGNENNNYGREVASGGHVITVPSSGTYRVTIGGGLNRIRFGNSYDKDKILEIEQWGDIRWDSFENAFEGCSNLIISATDSPDLSNITSLNSMFYRASSVNSGFDDWNVSTIKTMSKLFELATSFNDNIDAWDVSNVTNMESMFNGATSFNRDLNNWDVSSVVDMSRMFFQASSFNGDISSWDVSNVSSMFFMFYSADFFNSDISKWDVSNVSNMALMFTGADSFNQNIEDWDVSNNTTFFDMFLEATSFNQNLGNWNIKNATNMLDMLYSSGLDISNYDQTLIGWSRQDSLNSNLSLGVRDLQYCISSSARDYLIDEKGWTISGDSENCQSAFISSWESNNEGESESNQITIPANGGDYFVLWEDINDTEINGLDSASGYHTVNFPEPSNYRIKILGDLSGLYFSDLGDKLKITEIENWGDIQWNSMNAAFAGAENLTISANDAPDLSQVTDMSRMFYNAKSINQDISHWDVSNVTNMSDLFHGASSFNQDLSNWNVSNVTKMTRMFANTAAFNQDLNNWNTENVEEMNFTFWDADAFNGNISDWNTSNVNNMWGMFHNADSFDIDISNWDVSAVTNMRDMFRKASLFNQDINAWNVSNVIEMSGMFYEATAFDQNLGNWNLSNAGSLFEFLANTGLSVQNYDLSLEGWATNGNIPSDIALSAEGLYYCASAEYRQQLIDDFGWNIMGDETCSLAMQETMPAAEATSVKKDTEIYLTFDQEIKEIDLSGITLKDVSGNEISLTDIYIDSLTLHLVHNGLGSNTYEVVIPESSIKSITGKENEAISWSFTIQRILSSNDKLETSNHSTYPNPFSDFTTIQFKLQQSQDINLLIYDLKGQIVRREKYDNLSSGDQSIKFERKDLPVGLYRYLLQSANGSVNGKLLIE